LPKLYKKPYKKKLCFLFLFRVNRYMIIKKENIVIGKKLKGA